MENSEPANWGEEMSRDVSRRDALKKGALAGTAAFVIPVVTSLSMSRASAQSTSGSYGGDNNRGDNNQGDNNQGENNNR